MKYAADLIEKACLIALFIVAAIFFVYLSRFFSLIQIHFCSILFQATISFLVSALAWNSRKLVDNSFLRFLGAAFLFVGLINTGHLLCLNWTPTFHAATTSGGLIPLRSIPPDEANTVNYAAQMWILARYFESASFALSFLFLRRKINFALCFSIYATAATLSFLSIFVWHTFPDCFNQIDGFTSFKTVNHLVLTLVFSGIIIILCRHRRYFERRMFYLLTAVLVLSALAECAFSWKLIYYHISRPLAHLFKCMSVYLIYRAMIITGFANPIEILFRDQKHSRLTLARERDKLFSIFDLLPGFIYILSGGNTISYANQRFRDIFGDVNSRRCYEIFLNCHTACSSCPAQRVLETKASSSFEWKNNDGRTFIIHYGYFLDSDGAAKVLASGIDITDRVSARAALEENKERYRTLYEHTPVMLHSFDMAGHILNVSDHWLNILGYEKEAVIGKKFTDFLTPESRRYGMIVGFPALLQTGFCENVHCQLVKKNGDVMDVELSVFAEKDSTGKMRRSLAVSTDVTEKLKGKKALEKARGELEQRVLERTTELREKTRALEQEIRDRTATEEAMAATESKYSLLVENSLTGIYIKQDGKIIFANNKFCEIHGYDRKEIVGMDSWKLIHPYDRGMVAAYSKKRLENAPVPDAYESRRLTKNGNVIWVSSNNTRITYRDQPAILGNLVDITLRKKMEAELIKSEKDLRLLSAKLLNAQESERKRIALELHDTIAQNLVAIKFSLGQKLKQMGNSPPTEGIIIEDIIQVVQENISEIRRIMTDLRPSILDDLGILATISWQCREFQKIYTHIQVVRLIDLEEQEVPEELKIVIFRILQEAMNNTAKHSHADRIQLTLVRQNGTLELTIKDNGEGFDLHQVLSRINSSTGLGLVGMRERTEQSFGSFSISSRKNKGTRINARWQIGVDGVLISLKDRAAAIGDNYPSR
ncbi:MAG: PAS domain S-box protein [Pseudomonadota bacterium]